jgi:hypothetical protein
MQLTKKNQTTPMYIACPIRYRLAGLEQVFSGQGVSINGAELSFIAEQAFDVGKAMIISTSNSKNAALPAMTAFIEVIKTKLQPDGSCKITASIKSIKGD